MKYWLGVVSEEHVQRGMREGIAQVCHGKKAPLARIKKGDWLIYYSPKKTIGGKELVQSFTAIGRAVDDHVYQYSMTENFHPYRRKIDYYPATPVPIALLKGMLDLTRGKNWGYQLRFGLLELSEPDFSRIKACMIDDKEIRNAV